MARYSILTKHERDVYDREPIINSTEKFRIFNRLIADTRINGALKRYPTLSMSHIYTIFLNYIYSGRVYQHSVSSKNFKYVSRYLKVSKAEQLQEYLSGTFNKHKKIVMELLGVDTFSMKHKYELETYISSILSNKLDLKEIFSLAANFLIDKKVAVPSSSTLEKIILSVANSSEKTLKRKVADITEGNSLILRSLLELSDDSKYKITELKKLSHSVKMKSVINWTILLVL